MKSSGRYRMQLGLTSWLPTGTEQVEFGDNSYSLPKARTALLLGVTFDLH